MPLPDVLLINLFPSSLSPWWLLLPAAKRPDCGEWTFVFFCFSFFILYFPKYNNHIWLLLPTKVIKRKKARKQVTRVFSLLFHELLALGLLSYRWKQGKAWR